MSHKKLLTHNCLDKGHKASNCTYCDCHEGFVLRLKLLESEESLRYVHLDCFIRQRRRNPDLLKGKKGMLALMNDILIKEGYVKPWRG